MTQKVTSMRYLQENTRSYPITAGELAEVYLRMFELANILKD